MLFRSLAGERLDQVCVWPESTCGRLFERDRLDGRADPVVTDLGRRDAALMCDDLGGGEAAKAALAGPMPQRVKALPWLGPRQPRATDRRSSPAVASWQRQAITSSAGTRCWSL